MQVSVSLKTVLEFEDLEDINDVYEIVAEEMSADEIIELATKQGNSINVDVDEY